MKRFDGWFGRVGFDRFTHLRVQGMRLFAWLWRSVGRLMRGGSTTASWPPHMHYRGALGSTRVSRIYRSMPDGKLESEAVFVGVNLATHPHLAPLVFQGRLRGIDADPRLSVPFVFHDPRVEKMALVLPESLRESQGCLQAEWWAELRLENDGLLPAYVAQSRTVLGLAGLRAYLREARGGSQAHGVEPERMFTLREQELLRQQLRLQAQARGLAKREARLRLLERKVAHPDHDIPSKVEGTLDHRLETKESDGAHPREEEDHSLSVEQTNIYPGTRAYRKDPPTKVHSDAPGGYRVPPPPPPRKLSTFEEASVMCVDISELAGDAMCREHLGSSEGKGGALPIHAVVSEPMRTLDPQIPRGAGAYFSAQTGRYECDLLSRLCSIH